MSASSSKASQLQNHLEKLIARRKAHDSLPPERKLQRDFSVSRDTVRRALEKLATSGLIYRRHPVGTFVAPRRKESVLLVVTHAALAPGTLASTFTPFFLSLIHNLRRADEILLPVIIAADQFRAELPRLHELYPRLGTILIHTQSWIFESFFPRPEDVGVPVHYLGFDSHPLPPAVGGVLFSDEDALSSCLDALDVETGEEVLALGPRAYPSAEVRWSRFAAIAKRRGIETIPFEGEPTRNGSVQPSPSLLAFLRRRKKPLAVLTLSDTLGLAALNACLLTKTPVPERVRIAAIGHASFAQLGALTLTTAHTPMEEAADAIVTMIMDRMGGGPVRRCALSCPLLEGDTSKGAG